MNIYFDEVLNAHVAIQDWLGQGAGELQDILNRFSHRYSMITPAGMPMDYDALGRFLATQRGARPGLAIHIDGMRMLDEWRRGAVVQYRERQHLAQVGTTVRWSTVVFMLDENQRPVWRHLHETWQGG
jgi:hypothetical protein